MNTLYTTGAATSTADVSIAAPNTTDGRALATVCKNGSKLYVACQKALAVLDPGTDACRAVRETLAIINEEIKAIERSYNG